MLFVVEGVCFIAWDSEILRFSGVSKKMRVDLKIVKFYQMAIKIVEDLVLDSSTIT